MEGQGCNGKSVPKKAWKHGGTRSSAQARVTRRLPEGSAESRRMTRKGHREKGGKTSFPGRSSKQEQVGNCTDVVRQSWAGERSPGAAAPDKEFGAVSQRKRARAL